MTKREVDKLRKYCLARKLEFQCGKDQYGNYSCSLYKDTVPQGYCFTDYQAAIKKADWIHSIVTWNGGKPVFRE